MPGFMQSLKSPFSPNKKDATVITPVEVVALAEEGPIAEEQPSSVLSPGEALVQQTSSTVALTLTPANGESVQPVALDTAEVIPSEEPTAQLDLPVEPESVPEEAPHSVEPTETTTEASPAEVAQAIPEAATFQPAVPETDAAVVKLSSDVAEDVVPPTPQTEAVDPQVELRSDTVVSGEEPAGDVVSSEESVGDVVSDEATIDAPTEGEVSKPAGKVTKDCYSCNVKRNKSKKQKANASAEATEAGPSVSPKPRKSHPLADKLRSVIEQVKSKVKKDKEATPTPLAAPAAEPTPILEEIAASA